MGLFIFAVPIALYLTIASEMRQTDRTYDRVDAKNSRGEKRAYL